MKLSTTARSLYQYTPFDKSIKTNPSTLMIESEAIMKVMEYRKTWTWKLYSSMKPPALYLPKQLLWNIKSTY